MKVIIMLVPILLTYSLLAQKMTIKDSEENVLLEVNDEGASGSIFMPAGTAAPTGMVNKLYNLDGNLYWNGAVLSENDVNWIRENDDLYTPVIGHVGIGTEIPLSSLHVLGNDGALFEGTFGEGTITRESAGTRLMWIPKKAALRAGYIANTQWDEINIGNYSIGLGYNTKATGEYATAIGSNTTASGYVSLALGSGTLAAGGRAFTAGYITRAIGDYSTAMGRETKADALSSTVFGQYNVGGGNTSDWIAADPLFEIGNGSNDADRHNALTVLKNGDVGIGTATPGYTLEVAGIAHVSGFKLSSGATNGYVMTSDASGNGTWQSLLGTTDSDWTVNGSNMYSGIAGNVGIGTEVPTSKLHVEGGNGLLVKQNGAATIPFEGDGQFFMWHSEKGALRSGRINATDAWFDTNIGNQSTAFGFNSKAAGNWSFAGGSGAVASGVASFSFGSQTTASGGYSFAFGSGTRAINSNSTAIGQETSAEGYTSFASGFQTIANGSYSVSFGRTTTSSGEHSFSCGSGSTAAGFTSFAAGSASRANAGMASAFGHSTIANSNCSFVLGRYNVGNGGLSWIESDPLFEIGNGTSDSDRHNALTVYKNGAVEISTDNSMSSLQMDCSLAQLQYPTAAAYGLNVTLNNTTQNHTGWTYGIRSYCEKMAPGNVCGVLGVGRSTDYNAISYGVRGFTSGNGTKYSVYADISGAGYAVYANGDIAYTGSLIDVSDRKFKQNEQSIPKVITKIVQLNPKKYEFRTLEFNYMGLPDGKHFGLIAQEVEQVFPELVVDAVHPGETDDEGRQVSDPVHYKGIHYIELIPILLQAIQEQQVMIENLRQDIESLKR